MYSEACVRNSPTIHTPSTETVFRRIYEIVIGNGIGILKLFIDNTIKIATNEYDELYTGKENSRLYTATFHQLRGTDEDR